MNDLNDVTVGTLRSARWWRWVVLACIGLAAVSLMAVRPAAASGSGYHFAQWLVTLSFPNNQPLVELTTEIWYKPANGPASLVTAHTEPLNCTVSGNLQINQGIAEFSGQESIACEQPDMAQKINQVSSGLLNVPQVVPVRNAWVEGQVAVANNAPLNIPLPTHYHPGIQHGLTRAGAGAVSQLLRVDGALANSSASAQAAPFGLRAEFLRQSNGSYKTLFTNNGAAAAGNPPTIPAGLMLDLSATTIYFGYSPQSNSYFQGFIKRLTVDPGAFGVG
jgi:hypothetical protein